jgi:drug/metabolite transporter (DMT)-like permease
MRIQRGRRGIDEIFFGIGYISRVKKSGAWLALAAAILFGTSTPLAKIILRDVSPELLAGLLYLGSGLGLIVISLGRIKEFVRSFRSLPSSEVAPLFGAVLLGGIAGPALLMMGLRTTAGSTASLLLNMEGPFTVLLATLLFREKYGRRLVLGFVLIVAGGTLLSFSGGGFEARQTGWILIVGACLCWGFDNNLSKKVSSLDARAFAAAKGLIAGSANLVLVIASGAPIPNGAVTSKAMIVGFFGYGLSLVLFIHALRTVGAARTSAYFSTAPFVGAVVSLLLLHEKFRSSLLIAGILMATGVYLHLTEQPAATAEI